MPHVAHLSEPIVESGPLKERAIRCLGELPPFSLIINRLMASLANDDVSFSTIGDLIEKDAVVAGNLLHLVNSALYGRRGTINSVRHAVSLLGVNKLRNAVLGMSITRMWNQIRTPPAWSMARFNMHSAATAILSDLLAQRLPVNYPEGAFVAGLLHDVGRLMIALGLPEECDRVLRLHKEGAGTMIECERQVIGLTHPALSAEALAFWNLPEPIRQAVLHHHDVASDASARKPGEIALERIVDAANQYVNSIGVSILADNSSESADPTVIESLGLNAERTAAAIAEFKTEYEAMAQFFR